MKFNKIRMPKINWNEPKDFEEQIRAELITFSQTEVPEATKLPEKGYLKTNLDAVQSGLDYLRKEQTRLIEEVMEREKKLAELKIAIKGMEAAESVMSPHIKLQEKEAAKDLTKEVASAFT